MSRDEERHLRSAVLVDAENMVHGLRGISPAAADVFVSDPGRWLRWLTKLTYPHGADTVRRDVLVRICYLNPSQGGGAWRQAFVQAGFQIVDCPTLTTGGKNAADIHMVLAMIDLLTHPTRFDEIIILSSDADFTPVLTRLRAHDRRTVVIVGGPHAPVLAASCDHLVRAEVFIHEALAGPTTLPAVTLLPAAARTGSPAAATATAKKTATTTAKTAKKTPAKKTTVKKKTAAVKKTAVKTPTAVKSAPTPAAVKLPVTRKSASKKPPAAPVHPSAVTAAPKTGAALTQAGSKKTAAKRKSTVVPADVRTRASASVRALVAGSREPVMLTKIATHLRSALGTDVTENWDGTSSMKKFLQELDLAELQISSLTPGHIYDPTRHEAPAAETTTK